MEEITLAFLIIGLFFPRLTLLFSWIFGEIPWNSIPFVADVIMAVFIPRILIAAYCHMNGYNGWFIVYLILAILEIITFSSKVKSK